MKETIEIKQVHDNDKYIVTRKTVEEVTGKELVKIYGDMEEALKNTNTQLSDLPKQYEQRTEFLNNEKKMLEDRKAAFEVHAKKLKDLSDAEDKKEAITG